MELALAPPDGAHWRSAERGATPGRGDARMTTTHSIQRDLPDDLDEPVRQAAALGNQSVKAVLLGSLALFLGAPPADGESLTPAPEALPDERLWALVYRRFTWPEGVRPSELVARRQQGALTEGEQATRALMMRMTAPRSVPCHPFITIIIIGDRR